MGAWGGGPVFLPWGEEGSGRLLEVQAVVSGLFPDCVLVGGTATALHRGHRLSSDLDSVLPDLTVRYDEVLGRLEALPGHQWRTSDRSRRPVLILGRLDGVPVGIRQLRRLRPLQWQSLEGAPPGSGIRIPTEGEMLRIKVFLATTRRCARDFLDVAALGRGMGDGEVLRALASFEDCYGEGRGAGERVPLGFAEGRTRVAAALGAPGGFPQVRGDLERAGAGSRGSALDALGLGWDEVERQCARVGLLALRQPFEGAPFDPADPLWGGWVWEAPSRDRWNHRHRNVLDPQSRSVTAIEEILVQVPDTPELCGQLFDLLSLIAGDPLGPEGRISRMILGESTGEEAHQGVRRVLWEWLDSRCGSPRDPRGTPWTG